MLSWFLTALAHFLCTHTPHKQEAPSTSRAPPRMAEAETQVCLSGRHAGRVGVGEDARSPSLPGTRGSPTCAACARFGSRCACVCVCVEIHVSACAPALLVSQPRNKTKPNQTKRRPSPKNKQNNHHLAPVLAVDRHRLLWALPNRRRLCALRAPPRPPRAAGLFGRGAHGAGAGAVRGLPPAPL